MKTTPTTVCAVLLFAGCGVRVIGDLGDERSTTEDFKAGAAGISAVQGGSAASSSAGESGLGGRESSEAGAPTQGSAGDTDVGGAPPTIPELTAVPVAHLKLDECDGGPVLDTESDVTGARYEVGCDIGIVGRAASFPAEPATSETEPRRIELADEPRFAFTHELTIAAWIKPEQGSGLQQAILGKWFNMDSFLLLIRQVPDGAGQLSRRYAFGIAEPEGMWGRPSEVLSPEPVKLGVWTHVAGVYRWSPNGQVGHITLYVNGQPVAETNTKIGTDGLQQSTTPIRIGFVDQSDSFVGLIDEVRLYDVALGPEIAALYLDPQHP